MTTRPRPISLDRSLLPGLVAVGLFAVMFVVFLTEGFRDPAGFPDASVVGGIGYALIGAGDLSGIETENFLAALILVAILLDAALDGALMLAKREGGDDS